MRYIVIIAALLVALTAYNIAEGIRVQELRESATQLSTHCMKYPHDGICKQ